jgi:undecaprenyl-diphosphatase
LRGGAAGLLALTALLGAYASHHGPLPGERGLYDHPLVVTFAGRQAVDAEQVLVGLASPAVAVALVTMIAAMLIEVGERIGAVLVVAAAAVTGVSAIAKPLFGRHPLQHLAPVAHFPSGHVAFVTAVFGMTGLLAHAARRPIAAACCAVPVLGIGPAVLIGGGHLASDVVGGYLLGVAWILVVLAALSRTTTGL